MDCLCIRARLSHTVDRSPRRRQLHAPISHNPIADLSGRSCPSSASAGAKLRGGIAGKALSKVIFVGHSHGPILGGCMAADCPSDFAAIILTGFGNSVAPTAASVNQTTLYPASKYAPRVAGLWLGYMSMSSKDGRRSYFYGPPSSFDQRLFLLNFNTEDDLGLGRIFSLGVGLKTASAYTGPVFVITGAENDVFCINAQCGTVASGHGWWSIFKVVKILLFPACQYGTFDQFALYRPAVFSAGVQVPSR